MKKQADILTPKEKFGAIMSAVCSAIGLHGVADAIDANLRYGMREQYRELQEQPSEENNGPVVQGSVKKN